MHDLLCDEMEYASQLRKFNDPTSNLAKISKIYIRGPEHETNDLLLNDFDDDDSYYEDPECVEDSRVEEIFKAISTLPALREIVIDPNYYSEHKEESLLSSRVCWLLSKSSKLEALKVQNLEVNTQSEVDKLALAFSTCMSIKTLCIDLLYIGYRDVKTVVPLMQALAQLPNLTQLRLVFDAFCNREATSRYAQESLPILQNASSLQGVTLKPDQRRHGSSLGYKEISNCEIDAFWF